MGASVGTTATLIILASKARFKNSEVMVKKPKQPEFSEVKRCRHCGNTAPMERVVHYFDNANYVDEGTGEAFEQGTGYELLKCPACQKMELRSYGWAEWMDGRDVVYDTLYPIGPKVPRGLPPAIAKAYNEALKVRNVSANAYGGIIGRVIDLVCADKNAKGKDLYNKLAYLSKHGAIPDNLMPVADKLRIFRNVGAHAGLGTLTVREVPILENMTCAILEYLYSAPFMVQEAKKALDRLKQAQKTGMGTTAPTALQPPATK